MSIDVDKTALGSGKGLREFFRRKSNSGSTRNLDSTGIGDGDGTSANTSVESQDNNELSAASDSLPGSYGNYLTVSGTGASILKDLFHKKYRAGVSQQTATEEKEPKKKISFGQATFFGLRSKKDKGQDGGLSSSEAESQSKASTKGPKDGRNRHKSGPERALYATGWEGEGKVKQGKVKTFLDSFRMHSRTDSSTSTASHADPAAFVRQLRTFEPDSVQKPVTQKLKKFRVTPTKKGVEIGPTEFVEMYRSRAFSDSHPQDLLAARAAARHHKLSGDSPSFKSVDINGFGCREDKRHFVVWRDKRKGTKIFQLPSADFQNAVCDEFGDPDDADLTYTRFMRSHACYDLIPSSSKLVIFDTQLTVKKAFVALVQNGVRAAVLWDTSIQDFAGMLTVTDFIHILQKYYHSSQDQLNEVENDKILTWKELLECKRRMVCIEPECHLLDAVRSLSCNKVHRLLIVDALRGNPLNLLSHKRILKFLHQHMPYLQRPSFMDKTLKELQVGTCENLATLLTDAPLIQALNLFVERRISAIPIIDSEGRAIDLFAKIDIVSLIHEKLYSNLDVPVIEVLQNRRENFQGVLTCKQTETLHEVVERIVSSAVHRLIIVDENECIEGIVSLSDILEYLILTPAEMKKRSSSDLPEDAMATEVMTESSESALTESRNEAAASLENEDDKPEATPGNQGDVPDATDSSSTDLNLTVSRLSELDTTDVVDSSESNTVISSVSDSVLVVPGLAENCVVITDS